MYSGDRDAEKILLEMQFVWGSVCPFSVKQKNDILSSVFPISPAAIVANNQVVVDLLGLQLLSKKQRSVHLEKMATLGGGF